MVRLMPHLLPLLLWLLLLSNTKAGTNDSLSREGGLGRRISLFCTSPSTNHVWSDNVPGAVVINSDVLTIDPITAQHEGIYTCSYQSNGQPQMDTFNLTVLAVPQFNNCMPAEENCNPGTILTVPEGQPILVNISIQFVNGGARGVRQQVEFQRFIRAEPRTTLLTCYPNQPCTSNQGVSFTPSNNKWNGLVNISNAALSDSGVYYVTMELINPAVSNGLIEITSTVTINVTATPVPSSSSIIIIISSSPVAVVMSSAEGISLSPTPSVSSLPTSSSFQPNPSSSPTSSPSPSTSPSHSSSTPAHTFTTSSSTISTSTSSTEVTTAPSTGPPATITKDESTRLIVGLLCGVIFAFVVVFTVFGLFFFLISRHRNSATHIQTAGATTTRTVTEVLQEKTVVESYVSSTAAGTSTAIYSEVGPALLPSHTQIQTSNRISDGTAASGFIFEHYEIHNNVVLPPKGNSVATNV